MLNRHFFSIKHLFAMMLLGIILTAWTQEDHYRWNKAHNISRGLKHAELKLDKPRIMIVNAIRLDLNNKTYHFMTAKRAKDWGKPMPDYPKGIIRVDRQTTRKFMMDALKNKINMLVAANATPWSPWCPPWNHKYGGNLGLVISDGEIVDFTPGRYYAAFLVTKKGEAQIRYFKPSEKDLKDYQLALSGFSICLKDGVPTGDKTLHPRTAYGLSKDNRFFYILTVDGRQPGISEGIGTLELGGLMRYFGAWTAINMDGGGSTTLMIRDKKSKDGVRRANSHPHYRNVATSLGIYRVLK